MPAQGKTASERWRSDCSTAIRREIHETTGGEAKRDKHIPLLTLYNPFRRLLGSPRMYCSYVEQGLTVADLGFVPGFFNPALAESVGPEG